jgi:integrase
MENITEKLKEKGLSETSIKLYIRNLEKLNDDKPIKNLNFLKKTDKIIEKLKDKKPNTQRSYLISIVSILDCLYDNNSKLYKDYHALMLGKNNEIKDNNKPGEMSQTQEKNWKQWDEILKDFNELFDKVKSYKGKYLNKNQYNNLLNLLVSSLYIYQEPRRNQDYQKMMKIKKYNDKLPDDVNYIDNDEFIFNVYKTSKKYGQKKIKINDELKPILNLYFKYSGNPKNKPTPFLVDFEKEPLGAVNSITRILNKVFNKKIGSSMLRHIYLTHKFGKDVDEMKKTAENMGHTTETQKDYIKNEGKGKETTGKITVNFE